MPNYPGLSSQYKSNVQQGDTKPTQRVREHYYESSTVPRCSTPNKPPAQNHTRKLSCDSTSSSDYSNNDADENGPRDTGLETSVSVTKRFRTPSKLEADRRRLAIIEVDNRLHNAPSNTLSTTASIRERRGYKNNLAGLALVAPPDAALHTYTHLTPPSTAPLTSDITNQTTAQDKVHQRSASDITSSQSASCRLMGTTKPTRTRELANKLKLDENEIDASLPSRSVTPDHASSSHAVHSAPDCAFSNISPIPTPDIGESKDINVPVAAPVVVNLGSVTTTTGSYAASASEQGMSTTRNLVTDVHKTNDPARRRPPRFHSPVPPRPKKDTETAQEGRQATILANTASNPLKKSDVKPIDDREIQDPLILRNKVFVHRREGATAIKEPSTAEDSLADTACQASQTQKMPGKMPLEDAEQLHDAPSSKNRDLPPTPLVEPPKPGPPQKDKLPLKIDHSKFDKWLQENPQVLPREHRRGTSFDESRRLTFDRVQSPPMMDHSPPEPPSKGFKHTLSTKVKRFSSLSRATSRSSKSASRSSQDNRPSSRTPSPRLRYPKTAPQNFQRITSINPAALFCHEVGGQNTAVQRCTIYANKINELYLYDCGLSAWVSQVKDQSLNSQRHRGPSSGFSVQQPRQTSRTSVMTEATFPRRPDATTATDLTHEEDDDIATPGPPQLPYPSLALNTIRSAPARSTTSSSSSTPSTSIRSLTPSFPTSGFFAALGRKASLSKKDRSALSPPISSPGSVPSGARLPVGSKTKQSTSDMHVTRPIQIITPPTLPGGPRAPPSRLRRSRTYMSPVSPNAAAASGRDDILARRPSLNNHTILDTIIDIKPDEQGDKVATLIPHADKNALAGYLRHAGSDMLAIG